MTIIRDVVTSRAGVVETGAEIDDHRQLLKKELEAGADFRWQDGKGVVHELRGRVAYNVSVTSTIVWAPACGYRHASARRSDSTLPISCIKCLAEPPTSYLCALCWKHPCVPKTHNYMPDYRYPLEWEP